MKSNWGLLKQEGYGLYSIVVVGMQFNSMMFALFLLIVFLVYWLISDKYRWAVLLLSSYLFYFSWSAQYLAIMMFITWISYICAWKVEQTDQRFKKKRYLGFAVFCCVGTLFFLKYFNFFRDSIIHCMNVPQSWEDFNATRLIVPIGISFYSLQAVGYVIDVFRGDIKSEKNWGKYALFISFFPQVTSGPIERGKNVLPQFNREHVFNYEKVVYGLRLILLGFFKKLIIADNLGIYVDRIYDNLAFYRGLVLPLATILFSVQIYCDFSGYSDIAIGIAKLFDIDLMKNFSSPYFSRTIKEFWSKWHISLSTWFRDYVYIPLGGNRTGKLRRCANLMLTFIVSGLWHGANWTFVLWGMFHGGCRVIENNTEIVKKKRQGTFYKVFSIVVVFLLVTFAWMFFRANSLMDVQYILCNSMNGISRPLEYIGNAVRDIGFERGKFFLLFFFIVLLGIFDFYNEKVDVVGNLSKLNCIWRWTIYYAMVLCIIILSPHTGSRFVYFKF